MTALQFLLLLSAIYAAPRVGDWFGAALATAFLIAAIASLFIGAGS